jgi:hypothetical protein
LTLHNHFGPLCQAPVGNNGAAIVPGISHVAQERPYAKIKKSCQAAWRRPEQEINADIGKSGKESGAGKQAWTSTIN